MSFQERMSSPPMRRAYQVTYSMRLVADIAGNYNATQDAGHDLCARAMIEAFYVHIRLIAEFLLKGPGPHGDIRPPDFGVTWTVPDSAEANRLLEAWETASGYVVHLGKRRVPEDLDDLQAFEVDGQFMTRMAIAALTLMKGFVESVEASVVGVNIEPTGGKPVPLMVAEHLRKEFEHACRRVDQSA
jgi:hypothetical protein